MDFRPFIYGLLAHLIIGWAFFFFLPPAKPIPSQPPVPVQIHIAETPRPLAKPLAAGPGPALSRAPASPAPRPKAVASAVAYTDLIPKASSGQIALPQADVPVGETPLLGGHQFKDGSSGVTRQNLVIDASILSAALDVPLKARRITAGAEAFIRINRTRPGHLKIIDLRGDPMLRAVLFEYLQEQRVRDMIEALLDALEEESLPLTLQALTHSSRRLQDETDFTWLGRKLVIRKSASRPSRAPMGAITLPDEDAKKAVIQDRVDFERFQRSPAYRSTIQNHDLP